MSTCRCTLLVVQLHPMQGGDRGPPRPTSMGGFWGRRRIRRRVGGRRRGCNWCVCIRRSTGEEGVQARRGAPSNGGTQSGGLRASLPRSPGGRRGRRLRRGRRTRPGSNWTARVTDREATSWIHTDETIEGRGCCSWGMPPPRLTKPKKNGDRKSKERSISPTSLEHWRPQGVSTAHFG